MAAPKNVIKIWITSIKKYYSTNNKASWTSPSWAHAAAHNAAKRHGEANIEIHIFPVQEVVKKSYFAFKNEVQESLKKEKEMKRAREEKREKAKLKAKIDAAKHQMAKLQEFIEKEEKNL